MRKLFVINIACLVGFVYIKAYSQTSFKYIEGITYQKYISKEWQSLVNYAESLLAEGHNIDYFDFNIRIGIAYYELKDYEKAYSYFRKAFQNNSASQFVIEYLFWCSLMLNDISKANDYYDLLEEVHKERIQYHTAKFLDLLYVEGGGMFSSNPNVANHAPYGNVGIGHKLSHRFYLYHSYAFFFQPRGDGKVLQHSYQMLPNYALGNSWSLGMGLLYNYFEIEQPSINITGHDFIAGLNFTKTWKYFEISPHVSIQTRWITLNTLLATNQRSIESSVGYIGSGGCDFSLILFFMTLGADVFLVTDISNFNYNIVVSPHLNFSINERWNVYFYFFSKGELPITTSGFSNSFNSNSPTMRFNLTGSFKVIDALTLYASAVYDRINYNSTDSSNPGYQLMSFFLSLKISL